MTDYQPMQGSPDWLQERCGKVTASRIWAVMARTKTGYGAARADYMADIIAEQLTGKPTECYVTAAMQRGTDLEPEARKAYEDAKLVVVRPAPFVPHPSIPMSGASPDGYVGEDGLLEIKCPSTAVHIDNILTGEPDKKYIYQMQWQMACAGRKWCDFASYDQRMPEAMRLYVQRVQRDDGLIAQMEAEVTQFLAEVANRIDALKKRMGVV